MINPISEVCIIKPASEVRIIRSPFALTYRPAPRGHETGFQSRDYEPPFFRRVTTNPLFFRRVQVECTLLDTDRYRL